MLKKIEKAIINKIHYFGPFFRLKPFKQLLEMTTVNQQEKLQKQAMSLKALCLETLHLNMTLQQIKRHAWLGQQTVQKGLLMAIDEMVLNQEMKQKIVQIIFKHSGKLYGGWVRDEEALLLPKDLDARFEDESKVNDFVSELMDSFKVEIIRPSYNMINLLTILVQHKDRCDLNLHLDLIYPRKDGRQCTMSLDFDVNGLIQYQANGVTYIDIDPQYTSKIQLNLVRQNIARRQFVVLDFNGEPNLCHHNPFPEEHECKPHPVTKVCFTCYDGCICRGNRGSDKLMKRIRKMQARGWLCCNQECENPICIFSSEESYKDWRVRQDKYSAKAKKIMENRVNERKMQFKADREAQKAKNPRLPSCKAVWRTSWEKQEKGQKKEQTKRKILVEKRKLASKARLSSCKSTTKQKHKNFNTIQMVEVF